MSLYKYNKTLIFCIAFFALLLSICAFLAFRVSVEFPVKVVFLVFLSIFVFVVIQWLAIKFMISSGVHKGIQSAINFSLILILLIAIGFII